MNKFFVLEDTPQIKRMKKLSLGWEYGCSGELYKLLSLKTLHNLVEKIETGKLQLESDFFYNKNSITLEENFLHILNNYVGYVRDNYMINHNELIPILEQTLKNSYNKYLFLKFEYHKNHQMFNRAFKQMFLANIIYNTHYYAKCDKNKIYSGIQKSEEYLKNKRINNKKHIEELEKFYIKVINNHDHDLCNIFLIYTTTKKYNLDFYMAQLNWLYEKYYQNEPTIYKV